MYARLVRLAPIAIALLLSACGGGQKMAGSTSNYTRAPGQAEAAAPTGHADRAGHGGSTARLPQQRPGLGTTWGESRYSTVTTEPFVRGSSSPFANVALHYNDREGVLAHADYRGGARPLPYSAYTPNRGISVSLVDGRGRVLPGVAASGRTLIIGAEDQRYQIQIDNQTGGRYEVVASVDGLDVIDGRPADLSKRGYILEPYSSLVIDGFRQSNDHVAAFRFGRVSESYAARTSGDHNVGVVGVAFFAERGSPWTSDRLRRRDTANPFPGDRSYARPPR